MREHEITLCLAQFALDPRPLVRRLAFWAPKWGAIASAGVWGQWFMERRDGLIGMAIEKPVIIMDRLVLEGGLEGGSRGGGISLI